MNNYTVRIEVATHGCDFALIPVQATNEEEAKRLAVAAYEDNPGDLDYWASDYYESNIDTQFIADWEVTHEQ